MHWRWPPSRDRSLPWIGGPGTEALEQRPWNRGPGTEALEPTLSRNAVTSTGWGLGELTGNGARRSPQVRPDRESLRHSRIRATSDWGSRGHECIRHGSHQSIHSRLTDCAFWVFAVRMSW